MFGFGKRKERRLSDLSLNVLDSMAMKLATAHREIQLEQFLFLQQEPGMGQTKPWQYDHTVKVAIQLRRLAVASIVHQVGVSGRSWSGENASYVGGRVFEIVAQNGIISPSEVDMPKLTDNSLVSLEPLDERRDLEQFYTVLCNFLDDVKTNRASMPTVLMELAEQAVGTAEAPADFGQITMIAEYIGRVIFGNSPRFASEVIEHFRLNG